MIEKEKLDKIRENLPVGSYSKIAEATGFSESYVNMVMRGERPLNTNNIKIVKISIQLVEEKAKELEELTKKINNL